MPKFKEDDVVFSEELGEGTIHLIGGSIMGVQFSKHRYSVHFITGYDRAHPDDPKYKLHHKVLAGYWRDAIGILHKEAA